MHEGPGPGARGPALADLSLAHIGGRLRVIADAQTVPGRVDAAFHQILQAARGDAAATLHMLMTIARIADRTRASAFREALHRHARNRHRIGEI
jgi:uncharacterized membrane protein